VYNVDTAGTIVGDESVNSLFIFYCPIILSRNLFNSAHVLLQTSAYNLSSKRFFELFKDYITILEQKIEQDFLNHIRKEHKILILTQGF
jgi:hypothetical protein